jgi:hypothetical protein
MTPSYEYKQEVLNRLRTCLKDLEPKGSCLNCAHFQENSETCTLYKQRPPARVIVFGCDSFQFDDIPF